MLHYVAAWRYDFIFGYLALQDRIRISAWPCNGVFILLIQVNLRPDTATDFPKSNKDFSIHVQRHSKCFETCSEHRNSGMQRNMIHFHFFQLNSILEHEKSLVFIVHLNLPTKFYRIQWPVSQLVSPRGQNDACRGNIFRV